MADSTSLTGGWIAVIVVPSVCVVAIVLLVYMWWARRHRKDIDQSELERQVSKRVVAYERARAAYGRQYPHHHNGRHHRHHHHHHHHQPHRSHGGDSRSQRQYWYNRNLMEPSPVQDTSRYRWSKHNEALSQPATIHEEEPESNFSEKAEVGEEGGNIRAEQQQQQQAPLMDSANLHAYPYRHGGHHAPSYSADATVPVTPPTRAQKNQESPMNLPTPSNAAALWPVHSEPNSSSASPLQVYPSKQERKASMRKRLMMRANSVTKWGRFSSNKENEKAPVSQGLFTSQPQSYRPDLSKALNTVEEAPTTMHSTNIINPRKPNRVSRLSSVSSSGSRRSSKSQLSNRSIASIIRLQQRQAEEAQKQSIEQRKKDHTTTSMQIWDIGGIPKRQSSLSFSSSVGTAGTRSVLDKPLPEFPGSKLDSFPKLPPLQYFDSPLMPSVDGTSTPPPTIPLEYDGRGVPILKPSPPLRISKKSSSSIALTRDDLHNPLSPDDIASGENGDQLNTMTPKSTQTMYTARTSNSAATPPPPPLDAVPPPTRALHHRLNSSSASLLRSGTPPPPLRHTAEDNNNKTPRLEFSEIVAPHTPPPQRLFKFPPSSPPPTPPLQQQQEPHEKSLYASLFPKLALNGRSSSPSLSTKEYYGPPPPKLPVDLSNLPDDLSPESVTLVQSLTAERQEQQDYVEESNGTPVLILARAVHSYTPELDDELELVKGDWLVVYVLFDDGWCYGKLAKTGGGVEMNDRDLVEGICPKACLAIMDRRQI